ncbi:flagellar filament capping protein FliD [Nocardioides bruguierae]|uniref:flagellar filament capping protein FliD n=1 Tax=Nocardioides bruguierae TaxID=2945102 RepID=UPI0020225D51|nr:flagellar filament capping protein FliD [Nocardioides bruguierae]MCL8027710.1 flagellar filament capping protein FliD [Nocardioides bruguierae]
MATSSISGLASGLDSASIIEQFMKLEALPQTQLKNRITSQQSVVTKLQSLNSKAALLTTKAEELAKPAAWTGLTGTSSNENIGITASSSASAMSLDVTVTSVARTHQLGFATAAAKTDVVTGASTQVTLDRFDGSPLTVETGDGTLQGLVDALNDPANATGVRATLVSSSSGYRLMVESTETGAQSDFALTAADGSALLGGAVVRAGTDAEIDLGAGITATSTTNTFTELVPGVDLTLNAAARAGDVATVLVQRDVPALSEQMKGLVDAVNSLVSDIDSGTAYNATTKTSGALAGDAGVRAFRQQLLSTVFPGDGTSLADMGIQTDRYGKLVFDEEAFAAAYEADPEGVSARITSGGNGFAERVRVVADAASDKYTGSLTTAIESRQSGISRLQDDVDNWDTRLELRRTTLQNQFNALETALAQMQSQSSWLSSQLASLPSYSA